MTLNLNNGDFTPHIRWMASTSSWKLSGEDGPQPVTWQHAIFDLAGIQTGWGMFTEGEAPEWIMDPSLKERAPRPEDGREWKRGFKLNVYSESAFGGVREFATTATGAGMGISQLYEAFEKDAPQHPGKVPVVEYSGSTPTKIGKGNTNIPLFKIVEWRDRPSDLPAVATVVQTLAQINDHQAPLGNEHTVGDMNDPILINL